MYWAASLTLESAKMLLILFGILGLPCRKGAAKVAAGAYALVVAVLLWHRLPSEKNAVTNLILVLTILMSVALVKHRKCLLYAGFAWVTSTFLDVITFGGLLIFNGLAADHFTQDKQTSLLASGVSVLLCLLLVLAVRWRVPMRLYEALRRRDLVILSIGMLSCALYISSLQIVLSSGYGNGFQRASIMAGSIGGIAILVLCLSLILADNAKLRYKKASEFSHQLLQEQQNYYRLVLQKNEETRKLRHDMRNHVMCISYLYHSGKPEELEHYLDGLSDKVDALNVAYQSGNDLVNVILSHLASVYPGLRFEIHGVFPQKLSMDAIHLCTIFFNLLKNACEAVGKLPQDAQHVIAMSTVTCQNNLCITISNPVEACVEICDGRVKTTKSGTGHGYGILNAKECIEANGGSLELRCTAQKFEAEIVLLNVVEAEIETAQTVCAAK